MRISAVLMSPKPITLIEKWFVHGRFSIWRWMGSSSTVGFLA